MRHASAETADPTPMEAGEPLKQLTTFGKEPDDGTGRSPGAEKASPVYSAPSDANQCPSRQWPSVSEAL